MEQSRRRQLILALTVLVAGIVTFGLLARPTPERVEGHAFAIPSGEKRVMVEVLNGTSRQGLARVATRMLRQEGLDVVFIGNAEAPSESTRVLVRRGDPGRGAEIARILGRGVVFVAPDTLRRVDVTVVLGPDFRPRVALHP